MSVLIFKLDYIHNSSISFISLLICNLTGIKFILSNIFLRLTSYMIVFATRKSFVYIKINMFNFCWVRKESFNVIKIRHLLSRCVLYWPKPTFLYDLFNDSPARSAALTSLLINTIGSLMANSLGKRNCSLIWLKTKVLILEKSVYAMQISRNWISLKFLTLLETNKNYFSDW